MLRNIIEKYYTDRVTVIGTVITEEDGITTQKEGVLGEYPCFMTFMYGERELIEENHAPILRQRVKLFTCPEYNIPAGCKLVIQHGGRLFKFRASGCPAYYDTHQEVACVVDEDYAHENIADFGDGGIER